LVGGPTNGPGIPGCLSPARPGVRAVPSFRSDTARAMPWFRSGNWRPRQNRGGASKKKNHWRKRFAWKTTIQFPGSQPPGKRRIPKLSLLAPDRHDVLCLDYPTDEWKMHRCLKRTRQLRGTLPGPSERFILPQSFSDPARQGSCQLLKRCESEPTPTQEEAPTT